MIIKKIGKKEIISQNFDFVLNRILLISILFTLSFVICVFTMQLNKYIAVDSGNNYIVMETLLSAHRAGAAVAPENTLKAFSQCVNNPQYKIDILEFDLHLTKDNELILLHDDTLDRTSNAREFYNEKNVKAKDKTYSELRQLNMGEFFKNSNGEMPYKGLRGNNIPDDLKIISLNDILDYLQDKGDFNYIIEIKNESSVGKFATDLLYDILKNRNLLKKTIVGSFNGEVLKYIDKKYPDIIRSACGAEALSFYLNYKFNVNLEKMKLPFRILQLPHKDFGIEFVKKEFVKYAHKYGIAVQYWIEDENEREKDNIIEITKKILECKADAIITDNPKIAYDFMKDNSTLFSLVDKIFY